MEAKNVLPFINPATGERFGQVEMTTPAEVQQMMAELRAIAPAWARKPVAERVRILRQLQAVMIDARDTISATITQDCGKSRQDSFIEVFVSVDNLHTYCQKAACWLKPERVPQGLYIFKECYVAPHPYGVVGVIAPWNYPFLLAIVPMVAALLAGNVVLLKPSEVVAASGVLIEKLVQRVPELAPFVRVAHGDGAVGAALVSAKPDLVFLTGSPATGKKVLRAAADHLIPVVCELGGKDPMLVLEDADVAAAAKWGVWGAMFNAGQTCVSVERAYVAESVYENFVVRAVAEAKNLKLGYTLSPEGTYDVGPIIFPRQMEIIERHLQDAVAKGAKVLVGGQREGTFYQPTVLVDVDHSMLLMQEETFGPLLPIVKVKDAAEAIALANDSAYGLSASVWTSDLERGRRIAGQLHVGTTIINDTVAHFGVPSMTIGGFKESGFGRTHGKMGLLQFTQSQSLAVSGPPVGWDVSTKLRAPGNYNLAGQILRLMFGTTPRQRLAPVAEIVSEQVHQLQTQPARKRQLALFASITGLVATLAVGLSLWQGRRR